jgi:hypothetical protein
MSLFISLEIDCFHNNEHENICIAGLNRCACYATDGDEGDHTHPYVYDRPLRRTL